MIDCFDVFVKAKCLLACLKRNGLIADESKRYEKLSKFELTEIHGALLRKKTN